MNTAIQSAAACELSRAAHGETRRRSGNSSTTGGGTLCLGLAGSAVMWASFPPLDWGWLGWVALAPWGALVTRTSLEGRHPYLACWCAGFVFWMASLQWLRLPHWLTGFGWVALAAYLACYLPCFVAIGRGAVHRLGWSPLWIIPLVWTGLDYARAHIATGFGMFSLAHSQHAFSAVIQIADLTGEYGMTFLLALWGASIAVALGTAGPGKRVGSIVPAVILLTVTLLYGWYRLDTTATTPGPRVALVQSSIDTKFDGVDRRSEILQQCLALSDEALRSSENVDLIVWPESMFPAPILTWDPSVPPGNVGDASFQMPLAELTAWHDDVEKLQIHIARQLATPWIFNTQRLHFTADRTIRYNTSAISYPDGRLAARYDKIHPVMFGEYVPLGKYFPWLYRPPMPISAGIEAGEGPVAFPVKRWFACPSICYETILPHVVRAQVAGLRRQGVPPDFLVNVTNDGWFWGSSALDMHLICGAFRALENRRPLVIAANTGFSALIDSTGRILARGPRRAPGTLVVEVALDQRESLYSRYGDWFAGTCLLGTLVIPVAVWGRKDRPAGPSQRGVER